MNLILARLICIGTLVMTYLSVAKELVLFQNEHHNVLALIYRIATRGYYPLLFLNFAALLGMAIYHLKKRSKPSFLLGAAFFLFAMNVAIFSSNNVINWLEGQPLHRRHQGIGW